MKRKPVTASPKVAKPAKTPKKTKPTKIVQEVVQESSDGEEVIVEKVVAKASPNKKGAKVEKVVNEPVEEEVDSMEEEEVDSMEEEDQEDEDEEDNAVIEENEEMESDEENDDEVPTEEALLTDESIMPSKVKGGPIPATVPSTQILHVADLPKRVKKGNIVEAFAKYGDIDQVHIITTMLGTVAKVVFKTEQAAIAALNDEKKVKVNNAVVSIIMKKDNKFEPSLCRDRTVHVKNIKPNTNEEQLTKHFKSCGEVEHVKLITKFNSTFAYVTFIDKSALPAALKLHNSILNDSNIRVTEDAAVKELHTFDESRTIMLRNKQKLQSIDVGKLKSIFSKCGEIEYVDIVCKKHVLAFLTFTTEEATQKALKMDGKTVQDIQLEIELYSSTKKWTCIHVTNLHKDCTEDDLRQLFSKAGEIANIIMKKTFAIIRYNDSEGYCKSFLLNESFVKGQIIFVQPHSSRKHSIFKARPSLKKSFKRRYENGNSFFNAKKNKPI